MPPIVSPRKSFRVGRVQAYARGQVWYLCYHENGVRRRPRVGPDRRAAQRLAAQINAQLENGQVGLLSFEPLSIREVRQRWLDHHEHVLRSSLATLARYRTATAHLMAYLNEVHPARLASQFTSRDAESFAKWIRTIQVAPNGHLHSKKRPLMDKGVKYILETCRALFTYAAKRRHLPPYAENPFKLIEVDRIPIADAKPVVVPRGYALKN
jgi:integrase